MYNETASLSNSGKQNDSIDTARTNVASAIINADVTAGSGPAPSFAFDANNRIIGSGVTYDAAGNVTNDGSHSYTYDAENRIIRVGSSG